MNNKNYYTVFVGRNCGIYENESEAKYQIEDYPDGFYESYDDHEQAVKALESFFMGEPENHYGE